MAISLVTLRDGLISLLNKNNTTTSIDDISSGLERRITGVEAGGPDEAVFSTETPIVFVGYDAYTETPNTLGDTALRDIELTFRVTPVSQYGAAMNNSGAVFAMDENKRITQNILDLVRNVRSLSITGLHVNSIDVTMNDPVGDGTTYTRSSNILINCFLQNTTVT